jgi:hypothetical protein
MTRQSALTAPDPLEEFLRTSRRWRATPVPLPPRFTIALWYLGSVNIVVGAWLTAVRLQGPTCDGRLCSIATLGHPGLVLALAGTCAGGLVLLATLTRGLTRAGTAALVAMLLAALTGVVAVCGLVLELAVLAVLALPVIAIAARRRPS